MDIPTSYTNTISEDDLRYTVYGLYTITLLYVVYCGTGIYNRHRIRYYIFDSMPWYLYGEYNNRN